MLGAAGSARDGRLPGGRIQAKGNIVIVRRVTSLSAIAAIVLLGCEPRDTFRHVFYPNRGDLTIYTRGPSFDNLAQARQWVSDHRRRRRNEYSTYEIGKNCEPFGDSDIEVCEETLK